MSQVTHPALSARSQLRAHRVAALSAARQQPALRVDGGLDEAAVAATVGSQAASSAGPDESLIASAVSGR